MKPYPYDDFEALKRKCKGLCCGNFLVLCFFRLAPRCAQFFRLSFVAALRALCARDDIDRDALAVLSA